MWVSVFACEKIELHVGKNNRMRKKTSHAGKKNPHVKHKKKTRMRVFFPACDIVALTDGGRSDYSVVLGVHELRPRLTGHAHVPVPRREKRQASGL